MMTFYLWKADASSDFMPVLAGQVTVEGSKATVQDGAVPQLHELVGVLSARPSLPLTVETMGRPGATMALTLQEVEVARGDANWGHALSEALAREGHYTVSFTPEPV